MLLQALQTRIGKAETLTGKHMKVSVLDARMPPLRRLVPLPRPMVWSRQPSPCCECMEEAQASIETYALLKTAIDEIEPYYDGGKEGAEEFHVAIEKAKSCYEDRKSTTMR